MRNQKPPLQVKQMSQRRFRLPGVGAELLVVARHGHGASVGAQRLSHPAVGIPVVRGKHGRVAVVESAVGRVREVWRRAVGAHRDAGGDAAGVAGDDLRCGLGRTVLPQTPGTHAGLQVVRVVTVARAEEGPIGSPHPSPPPVVALLKHVLKRGVQHPEVTLALPAGLLGHLDEALVERQVVPYAVLPPFLVLLVIGEPGRDVVVYSTQGQSPVLAVLDGHGDEGHVRVGRLLLRTYGLSGRRVGADVQDLHALSGAGSLGRIHASGVCLRAAAAAGSENGTGSKALTSACRCSHSSHRCRLSSQRFLTLLVPLFRTTAQSVQVESGVTRLCFDRNTSIPLWSKVIKGWASPFLFFSFVLK